MESIARYLMIGGIILFLIGGGVYLAVKFGIPLGRLPGDIRIEGENGSFYFPVTTSILRIRLKHAKWGSNACEQA